MELLVLEDYTDTKYMLKAGDSTESVAGITEEHKERMLADYPHKFEVIGAKKKKETELVVESKEAKLTMTKKAKL